MGLKSVKQELFMNEMFLLKLGEMVLKGANRRSFEDRLKSNLRRRLAGFGNFHIYLTQSTVLAMVCLSIQ